MSSSIRLTPGDVFVNMPVPKPKWIWEDQLAEGCVTLLVGPPKSGKSLFVLNLISSIIRGSPLLEKQTQSCAVAYFALEEHASFLQQSVKKIKLDNQSVHLHWGPLSVNDLDQVWIELKEYCDLYGIKLLIIDPLAKFVPITDTNDYSKVYTQLSKVSHFARENNIHVMLVHHSNKGNSNNTNQILGSTGFFGVSDGAFLLSRNGRIGTLQSNLRYGDSLEPSEFEYDQNKNLIYKGVKSASQDALVMNEILEFLKDNQNSTIEDIARYCQIKRDRLLGMLKDLCQSEVVLRTGEGSRSSRYRYSVPITENVTPELNAKEQQCLSN